MRIGELAERAGTTPRALRLYERHGLLPAPARTAAGYRDYDVAALDRLRFIGAAKAAGFTLAEVRGIVELRRTGPPCAHVVGLLEAHATELDRRLAELTALRAEVERLRQRAATLDPTACEASATCHVIPV